ncbi:MAG: TIR domain-containing protein [Bacteroidota bacterium]
MMNQAVGNQKHNEQKFHDAFISYGRKESKHFALKLHNQLSELGYDIWLDQDDIPLGVDFQDQIDKGIENAHNFIFVISPHAINSVYCLKEIELALKYKKRIIPILHIEENLDKLHPAIGKINWVYMRENADLKLPMEQWEAIDNYDTAFQGLIALLKNDKDYVNKHTILLKKALEWKRNQYNGKLLLVGKERQQAEEWLLTAVKNKQVAVRPSELHCEYICEAKKNAENLMTDVFISYASENSMLRDRVKNALASYAITTWVHNKDIRSGQDFATAINEGIEHADSLVFFISNQSLLSEYCRKELDYALALNKRIIPVLIEKEITVEQPKELAALQFIDFTSYNNQEVFNRKIDELVGQLQTDKRYYQQHKIFLSQALKWERQGKNPSILLRGYNLQNAQAWLKIGKKRKNHNPVTLQEEFIETSTNQTGQQNIEVFVSYSRTDGDFARKINEQLQLNGKTTWFDQESIAEGADFQKEIEKGIETSDNFLFIISPEAVASEHCANEVAYASQLNKRFVTIYYRETDPKIMPPELAAVQWINFKDSDFHTSFSQLVRTLDTDREHLQAHTKWQRRAMEWAENKKDKSLLLRGSEFTLAEVWIKESIEENKKPVPTAIQESFIEESNKAINASILKEKKTNQRLKLFLVAAVAALLFALAGGFYAIKKGVEAKRSEKTAKKNEALALIAEKDAQDAAKEAKDAEAAALKAAEKEKAAQLKTQQTLNELKLKEKELEKALIEAERNRQDAVKNALEAEITRTQAEIEALQMKNFSKAMQIAKNDPTLAISALQVINKRMNKEEIKEFVYDIFSKNYFYSHNLLDHEERVYSVATSPDGKYIFSGGRDSKARVWDNEGNALLTFSEHDNTVLSIAFNPIKKQVISGSYDETALVWDLDGNIVLELEHEDPVWSVDVAHNGQYFLTSTSGKQAFLWDAEGNEVQTFNQNGTIWSVDFSPNDELILLAGSDTARIWDRSGNIKSIFPHKDVVYKAVFSPDGTKVLTGSWDRTTKLWSRTGELLQVLDSDYTYCVGFSPSGDLILTTGLDKEIKIWNLEGQFIKSFKGHTQKLRAAVFSGDNSMVISGGYDGTIKFWPIIDRIQDRFFTNNYTINAINFSPKNNKVLYSNQNNEAVLREFNTKKEIRLKGHEDDVMDGAFSPKGDTIVTAGWDKQLIFWSPSGKILLKLKDNSKIRIVTYSPDGKWIITANDAKDICIWDNTGKLKKRITAAHMDKITALEFAPNSNSFLSTSADKTATIWSLSGEAENNISNYDAYIFFGTFSPDGTQVLLCGQGNTANLYDLKGNLLQMFKGHTSYVISCAFSPDGKFIATGSTDRSVRLWSLDGKLFKKYENHKEIVNTVAFSKNGQWLLSTDDNGETIVRHNVNEPINFIEQGKIAAFNAYDFAKAGILDISDYINFNNDDDLITLANTYTSSVSLKENHGEKEEMLASALNIFSYLESNSTRLNKDQKQALYKDAAEAFSLLGNLRGSYYGTPGAGIYALEQSMGYYDKILAIVEPEINTLHDIGNILNQLEQGYTAIYNLEKAAKAKKRELEIIEKIAEINPDKKNIDSKIAKVKSDYAYLLLKMNNNSEALAIMETITEQYPEMFWLEVRLATTLLFNGKKEDAYHIYNKWKEKDYINRKDIFIDDFSDNRNDWEKEGSSRKNIVNIENGYFAFERTTLKDGWEYKDIAIDFEKDFEIEASIKIVRGVQNNSYTIDFGHNADEYNTFGFSGDGYYVVRSYFEEEWHNFKSWVKSNIVKKNDYNKLTIRKIDDKLYFFINEKMVHTMPFEKENWFGNNIGFSVQDTSLMHVDYLYVSQLKVERSVTDLKNSASAPWLNNYKYTFKDRFSEEFEMLERDGLSNKFLLEAKNKLSTISAIELKKRWVGMPYNQIDAALYWPSNRKAYFFREDNYVRFDLQKQQVDTGYPKNTAEYWPGVNFSKIDAACFWYETNTSYIFSGNQYILYNVQEDRAESGYPREINDENWPGVTFKSIDAAVSLKNGKTYFFSGDQYIRFDRKQHKADPNYPKTISAENWMGLEFENLDAAISLGESKIQFISQGRSDTWNIEKTE